jgi:hypothetical protein
MTRAERLHYMAFARRHGRPECDVEGLVKRAAETLGLPAGGIVERAAGYARILRARGATWRVAAAAGLIAAAREAGAYIPVRAAAAALRCSETAVRAALVNLSNIRRKRKGGLDPPERLPDCRPPQVSAELALAPPGS